MVTPALFKVGAGYVKRSIDQSPRQGEHGPWRMSQDYPSDVTLLRQGPVADDNLRFSSVST
jgi:monooxygenase